MCWSFGEMRIRPRERRGVGDSGLPGRMRRRERPTVIVKMPSTGELLMIILFLLLGAFDHSTYSERSIATRKAPVAHPAG